MSRMGRPSCPFWCAGRRAGRDIQSSLWISVGRKPKDLFRRSRFLRELLPRSYQTWTPAHPWAARLCGYFPQWPAHWDLEEPAPKLESPWKRESFIFTCHIFKKNKHIKKICISLSPKKYLTIFKFSCFRFWYRLFVLNVHIADFSLHF